MTWVRLDDNFADSPQVLAAGPEAAFLWICSIAYCSRVMSDGFVPPEQVWKLVPLSRQKVKAMVEVLVRVGLWSRFAGGFIVVNYLKWNPSKTEVLSRASTRSDRQARWRKSLEERRLTPDVTRLTAATVERHAGDVGDAAPSHPIPSLSPTERERGTPEGELVEVVPGNAVNNQASAGSRRRRPETTCPPTEATVEAIAAWAAEWGIPTEHAEYAGFLSHHQSKESWFRDWLAAWRKWQANARRWGERGGRNSVQPTPETGRFWKVGTDG